MEITNWIIRTLIGLVIVNLFVGGLYSFLKGYMTMRIFRMYWYRSRGLIVRQQKGNLRASVKWERLGEEFYSTMPRVWSIKKKEVINIFIKDYRIELNTWTRNGKGLMMLGVILISLSLFGFFALLIN